MAASTKLYTRLTRNASGIGSYTSLWLGPDHLMIVTGNGFTETYSRLMFRDIKGFFVTDSDRRLGWGIAWGTLSLLFLIITYARFKADDWPVGTGITLAITVGLFIWNHLLGPGCYTYVVTGVQTARLPSLVRKNKALRILGRVQPLIESAQADLVVPVAASEPPVVAPPLLPSDPPPPQPPVAPETTPPPPPVGEATPAPPPPPPVVADAWRPSLPETPPPPPQLP